MELGQGHKEMKKALLGKTPLYSGKMGKETGPRC